MIIRGIHKPLPNDLMYQESSKYGPSLVALARNSAGDVTAIQRTRLDPHTSYKIQAGVAKISRGCVYGSSVLIQNDSESINTVFLAEGVETALSIREAGVKGEIRATLGKSNLLNVGLTVDVHKRIILVADNDGQEWEKDTGTMKIVQTLRNDGFQVDVLFPISFGDKVKGDFNDVLKSSQGAIKIREAVYTLNSSIINTHDITQVEYDRGR